ncbi:MAG: sulfurtransferase TusA family protein [Gammaproteobacteria bacterium]|jgi:tRNA 2-thiouridine synthesizing protein A|nr:sulfurtransferase TusA family protein [Gammaproteobacteria bacterium]MBT3488538.1 sulfurtransferase TusA family protein [Gammaproteobacteria bacterium]MBT3719642.1 sulfurtransferase TusA family protein [Gammaproteobacteria bacterium]MBT3843731.1 sulfurtransferase TusA family protein [Gammaproteobacteria bacterium]MBT3892287.1 sulfurtransferase TusA family protein [Gammaproteobacteria bacterium]
MAEYSIDTQGLLCPMPVIRAQDKVEELQPGDRLEVLSSDPGAMNDIPAWCRINGHTVLEKVQQGREVRILIEVGEG